MQSADMAVLLTNSTANGGVGGQVDGVDPMRNPGKLRAAWVSKHHNGAFIHELGHLFGARREFYYHIIRERPKGPLAGRLGSFGRNLSALSAAAQAFRYLFRSFSN